MPKNLFLVFFVSFSLLTLGSCKSSRSAETSRTTTSDSKPRPADPGPGISPEHCWLVATLVSIDNTLSDNAANPCSKAPCNATIRVEEVLGYGSSFRTPLANGNEIRVHFLYTLASTKEFFPDMKPGLPGLAVGARFEADLFGGEEQVAGAASKAPTLLVGSYRLR